MTYFYGSSRTSTLARTFVGLWEIALLPQNGVLGSAVYQRRPVISPPLFRYPDRNMATANSILTELKAKGTEQTRKTYVRHGMPLDRVLGVSVADLKVIAKMIKGQQALAYELYDTGMMEAMYLAGLVADGSLMTKKQLNAWATSSTMGMISAYTVPWVTVENAAARELAMSWIGSKKEHVAEAGWCTYSGLLATVPDEDLDLAEIKGLLRKVVAEVHGSKNRVRSTMNSFVIAVGVYVKPLLKDAKAAALEMGDVSVDVGDTACKVPVATAYIEKIEASGKIVKKRKMMRC